MGSSYLRQRMKEFIDRNCNNPTRNHYIVVLNLDNGKAEFLIKKYDVLTSPSLKRLREHIPFSLNHIKYATGFLREYDEKSGRITIDPAIELSKDKKENISPYIMDFSIDDIIEMSVVEEGEPSPKENNPLVVGVFRYTKGWGYNFFDVKKNEDNDEKNMENKIIYSNYISSFVGFVGGISPQKQDRTILDPIMYDENHYPDIVHTLNVPIRIVVSQENGRVVSSTLVNIFGKERVKFNRYIETAN